MAKRQQGHGKLPEPPYSLRIHMDAPGRDRAYRTVKERMEFAACLDHSMRNLGEIGRAAAEDGQALADQDVEEVEALGDRFYRLDVGSTVVLFWISHDTRTVYVMHAEQKRLMSGVGKTALCLAARRLRSLRELDLRRAESDEGSA